ncbi:MAG TPA: protein kinase [Candidatus Nanoarchaeia archaeon]|nr:protein kinase [Candidatus Nanoarchaeia archaeon]
MKTTERVEAVQTSRLEQELKDYGQFKLIGQGGEADVYRAHRKDTGEPAAVKIYINPEEGKRIFDRFLETPDEVLNHPGLVQRYSAGVLRDLAYVIMQYIGAPSLYQAARFENDQRNLLNWQRIRQTFSLAFLALDHLHRHGYAHRDIKAANIMLGGKVIDLDSLGRETSERQQTISSTINYLAPEELEGVQEHRTDVYHLTAVLYEALTGKTPLEFAAPQLHSMNDEEQLDMAVYVHQDGLELALPQVVPIKEREHWNMFFEAGMNPVRDQRPPARIMLRCVQQLIDTEIQTGTPLYGVARSRAA